MTPLPPRKTLVGCKWIFTLKHDSDGSVVRHKACLVAKGFNQNLWHLLSWEICFNSKIDICSSDYLQLPHTIGLFISLSLRMLLWMEFERMLSTPGFRPKGENGLVFRLKKFIYGSKQSQRLVRKFFKAIISYGFQQWQIDHLVFSFRHHSKILFLVVYVHDIVLVGNGDSSIQALKSYIRNVFEVKDLGPLKYFLGIEVTRSSKGICLSRRKYALDLLKDTDYPRCKPIDTPWDHTFKLQSYDGNSLDNSDYY